jgi:ADP-heptose:LPS heptosyltransferase
LTQRLGKLFFNWFILKVDGLLLKLTSRDAKSGIALIRLDAIGDFVIWLDSAKEYRQIYPDQKITLIANAAWADLAKKFSYWDDIWPININHLGSRYLFRRQVQLQRVRKGAFRIAIQPTFSRVLMQGDSVVRATGATHRIGSVGDMSNATAEEQRVGNRWYTRLLTASPCPKMELLRNAEFFSQLGGEFHRVEMTQLPPLAKISGALKPSSKYFILFPGASWVGKQWPVARFAEALVSLNHSHGWKAVLCGASNEVTLCQAIADAAAVNCINLAGQTNLSELAEVIRGAQLLIANDTSAVHIAAAVGTPTVCILGGGHFGRFVPYPETVSGTKPVVANESMPCYHCNWHCNQPHDPNGPVPCISNITVQTVLNAVNKALKISYKIN